MTNASGEHHPVTDSLSLHRRAEYWMGMADVLGSEDRRLLAAARRFAARWERAAFDAIPLNLPRTRGAIAVSACSLLMKAGENDAAREWARSCLADEVTSAEARHELLELLKEAS